MSPLELAPNFVIDSKLVVGSASVETIYRLQPGQQHQADATLNIHQEEQTFGGSGLCNAVASARTGVLDEINFYTVGGTDRASNPDTQSMAIRGFLEQKGINVHIQYHPGSTEHSMIVLSGAEHDPKRGFRLTERDGSVLRNKFEVDADLVTEAARHPLLVVSSFPAGKVLDLATKYKQQRGPRDGLFVWTLNQDSAEQVAHDPKVQQQLDSQNVDVMFMSSHEYRAIYTNHDLQSVDTLVVTRGEQGCMVRSHIGQTPFEYAVPAFGRVQYVLNDNGAGEAHHNNFLATLTSVHDHLRPEADAQFKMNVVQTAARMGNLAAFLKIQNPSSLYFPDLNFSLVRAELLSGQMSPEEISYVAYQEHMAESRQ